MNRMKTKSASSSFSHALLDTHTHRSPAVMHCFFPHPFIFSAYDRCILICGLTSTKIMSLSDINDNIPLLLEIYLDKKKKNPHEKHQIELLAKQSYLIKISQYNAPS